MVKKPAFSIDAPVLHAPPGGKPFARASAMKDEVRYTAATLPKPEAPVPAPAPEIADVSAGETPAPPAPATEMSFSECRGDWVVTYRADFASGKAALSVAGPEGARSGPHSPKGLPFFSEKAAGRTWAASADFMHLVEKEFGISLPA